ncbi:hypothetical protein L1049_020684 [Liquidambar formosana]|uniref:Uncharacterized protein n=1 Tax=Liquidambar formosana TaxID=63359 RepID=A0AAP0XAW8_LIQFO
MPNMVIGNLQGHVSDLLSSIPINNNNPNTSIEVSGFNHPSADAKNHLKSHPHELMPMPPRPLNMAGPMFSSSSAGSLFGSPRSISSSSSSLQLSKNGHQLMASSSAHMSATALLQKAAQMGATVSSSMNSPMMQKGFVTSMAPSSFGGMQQQQQQHNIDYIQHNTDQSQLMGVDGGGFENHFMQKGPQGISSQFFNGNGGDESTDMGMFSQLFDQNHGLLKNMENDNSNSSNVLHGRNSNQEAKNPPGVSRFGGNGSKDVTTVDFLGIGGAQPPHNFHVHEQQHQHQHQQEKEMEFGGMGQGRIQGLIPFQQQVSHVQTAVDKPMWEV